MYDRSYDRFGKWRRRLPYLAGAAVLLIVAGVLFFVGRDSAEEPQMVTYSELLAALDEDRVLEVTFVDGTRLEGRMRPVSAAADAEPVPFESILPVPFSDQLVERLEAADVPISARAADTGIGNRVALGLLLLLVLGIVGLVFARGPGAQLLRHAKSQGPLSHQGRGRVSFEDVAGADEAKADLEEIVAFLKDPIRFTHLGGRMPRGVLLTGDPGNGKTLLARAVSGEAGCEFFSVSGSDFVEMFVGTGAARVRDLFKQARAHAPATVFIDEIDAVGRRRGSGPTVGGQDEREQALNQLLVEMDGFKPSDRVVVLAATNRPDVLDPALLRRGRFDRRVTVDYPDLRGREGILAVHTSGLPLAPDVSLEAMARGTGGLSGADLASIANEAALGAARRGSKLVEMRDLEEARDRVLLGSERRGMVLTAEDRRLTAYHEAGHAVVGMTLPKLDPIHKVTIIPRERSLGVTASLPERDQHTHSLSELRSRLVMLVAGRAAEERILGAEHVTTGAANDIRGATRIARQMVVSYGMSPAVGLVDLSGESEPVAERTARIVDEEIRRMVEDAYAEALEIVDRRRDLLERMANALLERRTLDQADLAALDRGDPLPPATASDEKAPAASSEAAASANPGLRDAAGGSS